MSDGFGGASWWGLVWSHEPAGTSIAGPLLWQSLPIKLPVEPWLFDGCVPSWSRPVIAVLVVLFGAAMVAPWLVARIGRRALSVLALAPACAVVWALMHTGQALSDSPPLEHVAWIPGLDMDLWFRMDALSWLMTLIVGGVGAMVMVYASAYFHDTSTGLGRFAGVFTAFTGAMLGLVTVDQSLGIYVFWEATSLLSFLLIGHHHERRPARAAARQALLVTTSGALAMFAGFVMLGLAPGGSFRVSELVQAVANGDVDVSSPETTVAAVLILIGAFSKSALVPFHFWLPGAMSAPTPVSAFLHAAAMVKAGVYLIARLTPGFTEITVWSPLIEVVGLTTLLVGGWRALRQYDLKLVLAYGTVSQLGLITAAVGQGSAGAMMAGLTMLVAHSLFKSTLFLTVGAVESATGTRDLRHLSGLGRRKPVLAGAAGLAALSMAGVPLTTGYLGKETFLASLVHGSGAAWSGTAPGTSSASPVDLIVTVVVAVGSVLTVAYSWRVWWGAFGTRPQPRTGEIALGSPAPRSADGERSSRQTEHGVGHLARSPENPAPTALAMTIPIVALSLGALIGLFAAPLEGVLAPHGQPLLPGDAHLAWWSGWAPGAVTAAILAGGVLLAATATRFSGVQNRLAFPVAITDVFSWSLRELEILATSVTRLAQRGSLPWDLSTIAVALAACVGVALAIDPPQAMTVRLWDSALQVGIAVLIVVAVVITARSRRRMRAALSLGAVGLGVAVLYASHGAPDLALTQLVVEAVSIVVYVLVLRKLPPFFSDRPVARSRWWHLVLACALGAGVVVAGLAASSARVAAPVSELMPSEALGFGHGQNIVNVILVDIRAWDTVGELSVMLVTATGVASLVYATGRPGRRGRAPSPSHAVEGAEHRWGHSREGVPERPFLPTVGALSLQVRSTVLEVTTRLLFPTMLVLSLWLLFIGHNNPGGGFVGGAVAGIAFVLRYLAGGNDELTEAIPLAPGRIMGLGLFIAGAGALSPLLAGNAVLQSTPVDWSLGPVGALHFTTAMILDVGVYVLIVGLVLDLVASVGGEIDRQSASRPPSSRPRSSAHMDEGGPALVYEQPTSTPSSAPRTQRRTR